MIQSRHFEYLKNISISLGIQKRSRKCDSPAPLFNGSTCAGSAEESQICYSSINSECVQIKNENVFMFPYNLKYLFEKKLRKSNRNYLVKENAAFNLTCNVEYLEELEAYNNKRHAGLNFSIEWIHGGKLKLIHLKTVVNYKIGMNTLIFTSTSLRDTGLHVCLANLPYLNQSLVLDFAFLVVIPKTRYNYVKHPGESLAIPCDGLVLKSLFPESVLNRVWYKDNVSIKTESIDWLNWSDHELGCVDSYVLKNLNYNDTGVYKCEIHDLSDSRTWIANVVSVTVGSQQVNNFLSNEKFWILFVIVSVVIVSLNLGVLLKNMLGL